MLCLKALLIIISLVSIISCDFNSGPPKNSLKEKRQKNHPSSIVIDQKAMYSADTYTDSHFAPANMGFILYDPVEKKVLLSHNSKKTFMPASTAKLITTISSFMVLGDEFKFKTHLFYDGKIKNNVLHGDLYLVGGGDPSFNVADLVNMAAKLRKTGIHTVKGKFYFDKSALTSRTALHGAFDHDESYNSGISALSCEYNYVSVKWKRPDKDDKVEFTRTPHLSDISIERSDEELQEHQTFEHTYESGKTKWYLSKKIDKKGEHRLPVKKTALHTALLFQRIAGIHGIKLSYPTHKIKPPLAVKLIEHKGGSLDSIVKTTLLYSVNQLAELLYLQTAKILTGKKESYSDSGAAIEAYLKSNFSSIDWTGFSHSNGSGLTTTSRVSPEQLLSLLIYADNENFADKDFEYYLSASGWGWTLKRRFARPYNAFHVYAKTGTINYAAALAGYLYPKSGKRLIFVFFNHDVYLRTLFDRNPKKREKEAKKDASRWHGAYLSTMDRIINSWILDF